MTVRRDPSFERMAFVSLVIHAVVILASGLTFSFQARRYVTPNPYFVSLVTSSQHVEKPEKTKKKPAKIVKKTTKKTSAPAIVKKKVKKPTAKKVKKTKKKQEVKPDKHSALRSNSTKKPEPKTTELPKKTLKESPEERVRNKIERLQKIDKLERLKKLRASIGGYELKEEGLSGTKVQKTASPEAMAIYYGIIRYRVLERWVYTGKSISRLEAEVLISLSKQGGVQKQSIVKSSGNPDFDRSVLRAIAKASPFPPPPEGVDTEIQFRFRPEDIQ